MISKNLERTVYNRLYKSLNCNNILHKKQCGADHDILIYKLKNYGVRGNNLKWFESYLNNRKQYISFNNNNTSFANVKCGVPQGSTLEPLLFLTFVNNLNRVSDILYPRCLQMIQTSFIFIKINTKIIQC